MTYDDFIADNGLSLPISGFEDLVFDYLEHLNEETPIPILDIMFAIHATQDILPHIEEMNTELGGTLEGSLDISQHEVDTYVH